MTVYRSTYYGPRQSNVQCRELTPDRHCDPLEVESIKLYKNEDGSSQTRGSMLTCFTAQISAKDLSTYLYVGRYTQVAKVARLQFSLPFYPRVSLAISIRNSLSPPPLIGYHSPNILNQPLRDRVRRVDPNPRATPLPILSGLFLHSVDHRLHRYADCTDFDDILSRVDISLGHS